MGVIVGLLVGVSSGMRARRSRKGPISPSGMTLVDGTWRMALAGMSGRCASRGSCAIARPPCATMLMSPAVPQFCAPVKITPTTRGPYDAAALRNSGSTAGR